MEQNTEEIQPQSKIVSFITNLFWVIFVIGAIVGVGYLVVLNQTHGSSSNCLNLGNLEGKIYKVVENNGDLRTFQALIKQERLVRHPNSELNEKRGDFLLMSTEVKKIYKEITTEQVLLRMKAFYISVKGNKQGDSFLSNANRLIKDYNYLNPFEILEVQQKYPLENIKIKTDTLYEIIEEDVNRVVEELDRKNNLVNEYLSKSRQSYRNSIIAMFISTLSLIVGITLNLIKIKKKHES